MATAVSQGAPGTTFKVGGFHGANTACGPFSDTRAGQGEAYGGPDSQHSGC